MNDAFALAGRASSLHHPQGVALGYVLLPLQGEALNTEARSHGEYIFKFSEDTENLKTPWLCVFIYSISNFGMPPTIGSLLYVRPLKKTQVVALRDELILITRYV